MRTVDSSGPCIQDVRVTGDKIIVSLGDGRIVSVPLAWSWRLSEATPAQRNHFRIIGTGQGIHWPDIDEDVSVEGLLHGSPAPRPKMAAVRDLSRPKQSHSPSKKRMQPSHTKRAVLSGRRGNRA